jgi:hypothetical protein
MKTVEVKCDLCKKVMSLKTYHNSDEEIMRLKGNPISLSFYPNFHPSAKKNAIPDICDSCRERVKGHLQDAYDRVIDFISKSN